MASHLIVGARSCTCAALASSSHLQASRGQCGSGPCVRQGISLWYLGSLRTLVPRLHRSCYSRVPSTPRMGQPNNDEEVCDPATKQGGEVASSARSLTPPCLSPLSEADTRYRYCTVYSNAGHTA